MSPVPEGLEHGPPARCARPEPASACNQRGPQKRQELTSVERLLEDVRFAVLEQRHIIEQRTERGAAKGPGL